MISAPKIQKIKTKLVISPYLNLPFPIIKHNGHYSLTDLPIQVSHIHTGYSMIHDRFRVIIREKVFYHCGRHTYATTVCLSNDVPIETLSKMLGHRSIRTTQIYASAPRMVA